MQRRFIPTTERPKWPPPILGYDRRGAGARDAFILTGDGKQGTSNSRIAAVWSAGRRQNRQIAIIWNKPIRSSCDAPFHGVGGD
jgi:hypothetical protein